MREIASKMFTQLLFSGSSNELQPIEAPETIFTQKYVRRRCSAQGCTFLGLENKNLTFKPPYSGKPLFWGPILTGQNFRPKTAL